MTVTNGVLRCSSCSTYFAEPLPPLWLDSWPAHCNEPALLDHVLEQRPTDDPALAHSDHNEDDS
jgi:hypothetical protein